MTYAINQLIARGDINSFFTSVGAVWGTGTGDHGYGQSTLPAAKALGDKVTAANWLAIRNAIANAALHQGTVLANLPPTTEFTAGDIVEAHESSAPTSDAYDFDSLITLIDTNRLNIAPGMFTVSSGVLTASRVSAWGGAGTPSITCSMTATFSSGDAARYFFNSGGQIRVTLARTGGSATAQNTAWTNALAGIGTITFGAHGTTRSGTLGTAAASVGYYELAASDTLIFDGTNLAASPYGANDAYVYARGNGTVGANADRGNIITFTVLLQDQHSNAFFDTVDGSTTATLDERRATTVLTIAAPSYAVSIPF